MRFRRSLPMRVLERLDKARLATAEGVTDGPSPSEAWRRVGWSFPCGSSLDRGPSRSAQRNVSSHTRTVGVFVVVGLDRLVVRVLPVLNLLRRKRRSSDPSQRRYLRCIRWQQQQSALCPPLYHARASKDSLRGSDLTRLDLLGSLFSLFYFLSVLSLRPCCSSVSFQRPPRKGCCRD